MISVHSVSNLLIMLFRGVILSTMAIIVSMIILRTGTDYKRAFISSVIINVLIGYVLVNIYLPIPYFSYVLEAITWIVVLKLVLRTSMQNSFKIGILAYIINMPLVYGIGFLMGFI